MISNNPFAMGTRMPGAPSLPGTPSVPGTPGTPGGPGGSLNPATIAIMQGLGMPLPQRAQGFINPLQQPQTAGMQAAPQPSPVAPPMDMNAFASMAQARQNVRAEGQEMVNQADSGAFRGTNAEGVAHADAMREKGQYLMDNPLVGGLRNRFGLL